MDNQKQYFWGIECKEVSEEEYNRLVLQHQSPTHAEDKPKKLSPDKWVEK
jgi:hypothetical protein